MRELFLQDNSYKYMTNKQIRDYFNENLISLKNKIKLYNEIQKLKLLLAYPSQRNKYNIYFFIRECETKLLKEISNCIKKMAY